MLFYMFTSYLLLVTLLPTFIVIIFLKALSFLGSCLALASICQTRIPTQKPKTKTKTKTKKDNIEVLQTISLYK